MKIAVSSMGKTLDDEIDPRFGRAAYLIVVDSETMEFKVVDNQANMNALQGAGIQAAMTVAREGADVLLTGYCGPNAFATLNAAEIKVVADVIGTVKEGVQKFMNGPVNYTQAPNVEDHWT